MTCPKHLWLALLAAAAIFVPAVLPAARAAAPTEISTLASSSLPEKASEMQLEDASMMQALDATSNKRRLPMVGMAS